MVQRLVPGCLLGQHYRRASAVNKFSSDLFRLDFKVSHCLVRCVLCKLKLHMAKNVVLNSLDRQIDE